MILPSDPEYREAREYKEGRRQMVAPFLQLAKWIAEEFDVPMPLQVRLDEPNRKRALDRPRLDVVFDRKVQASQFDDPELFGFDEAKQERIGTKFLELAHEIGPQSPLLRILPFRNKTPLRVSELEDLYVIFSDFETVARVEANAAVSSSDIERLERELRPAGLWKVHRQFEGVVFMFETDAQVAACANNGNGEKCRALYSSLLAPHDRYGYFSQTPIIARFDSKEAFERDYRGNWFFYDR